MPTREVRDAGSDDRKPKIAHFYATRLVNHNRTRAERSVVHFGVGIVQGVTDMAYNVVSAFKSERFPLFFASIEQRDRPEWRGRPVAITNGRQGTCIITCSYEARAYGIRTGMRLKQARRLCPELIQCPARPERYAATSTAIMAALQEVTPDIEVFLGDTMGEVPLFYAAADVAFVGGTLVPVGGHNLLEPAALGKPVITGPHLFNTQDIANKFEKLGASITVNNAGQLGEAVADLFADPETTIDIGNRGREIVQQNRGSLDRLLTLLEPLVGRPTD